MHYCETCKKLIKFSAIKKHESFGHKVSRDSEDFFRTVEEDADDEGKL